MKHYYDDFSPAQFLTDEAFVQHQLAPTTQSTVFWETWLNDHPPQRQNWQQAVDLLDAIRLGLHDYAQTHLTEETIRRLWLRIQMTNAQANRVQKKRVRYVAMRWVAAATVTLAVGLVWWQQRPSATPYTRQVAALGQAVREQVNNTTQTQTIRLPDQSVVMLTPNSRLSYAQNFGEQNRDVYLQGEATFDVTHNARKPFLVHANEIVTKVLGTRFMIRAFAAEAHVRVQVQQGQVSVYANAPANTTVSPKGVLLLPNQQVVFTRKTEQFDKKLVDAPRLLTTLTVRQRSAPFTYSETPIAQVIDELQVAYGVSIRYNKEALLTCQLTASLANESFAQKLEIICRTIGATSESIDGQIVISGGSCE